MRETGAARPPLSHCDISPARREIAGVTASGLPLKGGAEDHWPFGDLRQQHYRAILADPPWETIVRSDAGLSKSPEKHYQTMRLDDLKALPVAQLAARRCVLVMWTTWPQMENAIRLARHWGFDYKTGGPWVKRTATGKATFGTGYLYRNASEAFITCTRGGAVRPGDRSIRNLIETEDADFRDLDGFEIDALRREHSRKPDEARLMIDRIIAGGTACELFAREPWPGRDVWGFETSKFASAETQTWQKGEAVLSGEGPSASPCEGGVGKFGGAP